MKTQHWYIIIIILVLAIISVLIIRWQTRKNAEKNAEEPRDDNGSVDVPDVTTSSGISEAREAELKALARKLKTSGYAIDMREAALLPSDELIYLDEYYRFNLSLDSSLYKDTDDRWLPLTSEDEFLMKRLKELGLV